MARRKSRPSADQPLLAGFEPPAIAPASGETATPKVDVSGANAPPDSDPQAEAERASRLAERAAEDRRVAEGAPQSLSGKTVYVVDAHSLIYQVFHAMPDMSGPTGQPVGAIHGFTRDLLDLMEKRKPDYLLCAFDASEVTFRHEIFADYKASRESMPDDLRPQIANIRRMLDALGIPALERLHYEADDILATLAREVERRGGRCFLVTSDKDCRQLITDQVAVFNIRKNQVLDAAVLHQEWGIRPDQVVDFQSLVGDSVDDVPGVPLIGPKLARELLGKFDTLEGVLDNADQVSGPKRRQNLVDFREQALLSRELVRLCDETPIDIDWTAGRVGGVDRQRVLELCAEFGFRRLGDRLAELTVEAAPPPWQGDYRPLDTPSAIRDWVDGLPETGVLAIWPLLTSARARWADLFGLGLSVGPERAVFVKTQPFEWLSETGLPLRRLLEAPQWAKVGQGLKELSVVLRRHGVQLGGVACDTQVADYLLAPGERTHELEELARRHLAARLRHAEDLLGSGAAAGPWDAAPAEKIADYACRHADAAWRLAELLQARLQSEGLDSLHREMEVPLLEVLAEMEYHGVAVDVALLQTQSAAFARQLEQIGAEIFELAGGEFNIDSPKQLAEVLFEKLGLPVVKKGRTGPSTDAEVLSALAQRHPLPARLLAYRQKSKLKGTYLDALPALVHPTTGRVHTTFRQDVAATGRLSSQDPNLQNIPIRTAEGRAIRAAFVADGGAGEAGLPWRLISADYSQIELRVLAHYCDDPALREAFQQGKDIHAIVAAEIFGVPEDQVTREQRGRAKAVNFGVIYGQTAFGLAKALEISKTEAAEFIERYFQRYPRVDEFVARTLEACRQTGYVETLFGRRRLVDGVRSARRRSDSRQRTLPERIAVNAVIQGTAADLIKRAMILVWRRLRRERPEARLLLQIHDELLLECPAEQAPAIGALVREEMLRAGASLKVPLLVDLESGASWAKEEHLSR